MASTNVFSKRDVLSAYKVFSKLPAAFLKTEQKIFSDDEDDYFRYEPSVETAPVYQTGLSASKEVSACTCIHLLEEA